jgi:hypothetical protein
MMGLFGRAVAFVILAVLTCAACHQKNRAFKVSPPVKDSVPYDSLKTVLENIYDTDQGIREKLMVSKGEELGKIGYQMMQIDSVNQARIKPILHRYGWLPKSKVGEKASDAIFFVIQHSGFELMRQYFPSLKDLASKGEANPTHAAMMEDRLLVNEGKKQIYGTQATSDSSTNGKTYIWPIKNPDMVNQLRKETGFDLTVEENAKRLDAIYDPKRELPNVR